MKKSAHKAGKTQSGLNKKQKLADQKNSEKQLNALMGLQGADTLQRMVLEQRILLDAAGMETADSVADQVALEQAENWQSSQPEDEITANIRAISEADEMQEGISNARNEIVFIDSSIDDFQTILDGIHPSTDVIILDPNSDGVEQIASALANREAIDAIHIISHGRSGTLDLGNAKLTEVSINGRHADEMQIIRNSLSEDADILIYGCDFGAHARGVSAIEAFSQATGADVAASIDLTGAANLGGDWDLEIEQGAIETSLVLSASAQANFSGTLLAPTIDLDFIDSSAVPGQNNFTELDFNGLNGENNPQITNNGQSEDADGIGNGETALYQNVGVLPDGTAIDIQATVISFSNLNPGFSIQGGDNANVGLGGGGSAAQNTATIRWDVLVSGTDTPITGNFTVLVNDLDNRNNDGTFEEIQISAESLDAYELEDPANSNITVTENAGVLTIRPTDNDPGTPGVLSSNTVQLSFTNTSSFEVFYNRNAEGANFGLDGNFVAGFFTNPVVVDTNANFANVFTEGEVPVAITADTISISDEANITSAVITISNPQPDDLIAVTGSLPPGITIQSATSSQITLSGDTTPDEYEQAIQAITFENTSEEPNETVIREINITLEDDENLTSNTATASIQVVGVLTDTDDDGVPDDEDIDDDNDGILDVDEGFIPAGTNFLLNSSFELLTESAVSPDGFIFGGGFGEFGNDVQDWDLVSGTAEIFHLDGATSINGTTVPEFRLGDISPFAAAGTADPGPSDGLAYAGFHSGDGLFDTPGEQAAGRETIIQNLAINLQPGVTYTLTIDIYQADGLVSNGRSGGIELYTIDEGATPNAATAYQDGTVVGGIATNAGANGITFVGLSNDVTADGTAASGTAENGTQGYETITFTITPTTVIDRLIFTPESGLNIYYVVDNVRLFANSTDITRDSDADGFADHLDIDSDDDGITDNIEAQSTTGFIAPSAQVNPMTDVNRDGLDDNFDQTASGGRLGIDPVNSDGQDVPDVLDDDSDNDNIDDINEAGHASTTLGADTDQDGLRDVFEGSEVDDAFVVNDGITPLDGTLPDADQDAAAGIPLSADLDFRDAILDATPPEAQDDNFISDEDGLTGDGSNGVIAGNLFSDNGNGADSDLTNDAFTVTAINSVALTPGAQIKLPSGALLTVNANGTFEYDLNGIFNGLDDGENGSDSFTYTITDSEGLTDTATASINVSGENDVPIIDLNGALPGTDFADVFVEDEPGQPLANLLTLDAVVDDPEDNIAQVSITPNLPPQNDGSDEFLRIDKGNLQLTIDLASGDIITPNPLTFGNTTFDVAYDNGSIIITDANNPTFESEDLQGFLRLIAYQNVNQDNTNGDRDFEFEVTDPVGVVIATSTISVDRVNDAPVPTVTQGSDGTVAIAGAGNTPEPILTLTPESGANAANLSEAEVLTRLQNGETASDLGLISVDELLAQLDINDIEQTEFGIGVIFADESEGHWEYLRTDIPGHEWTDFDLNDPDNENAVPVPEGQALLFDPDTVFRFVADPGFTGGAQLEFRVWDQSAGIASNPPSLVTDDSGGIAPTNTSSLSSASFVAVLAADTDGDGVINADDVDDDNDGILDTDESGSVDIVDGGDFSDPSLFTTNNVNYNASLEAFVVSANNGVSTITQNLPNDQLLLGTRFEFGWNNGTLEDVSPSMVLELTIDGVVYARVTTSDLNDNEVPGSPGDDGFAVVEFLNGASGIVSSSATAGSPGSVVDNGDGTFSVAETGFNSWSPATLVDIDLPSGIVTSSSDVVLTFDATTDPQLGSGGTTFTGLDDIAVLNLSVLGFAEIDSDSDGIADHLDIDSDDDGITDTIEAQATDNFIAPSGVAMGITDINNDGLDDNFDARGVNGAGTLTNSSAAATSADRLFVPQDTDGLGGADLIDPDSDNDGIRDADENGLGVTFVAGDADGDGLADVYENAIDGNANDGFVVNEGITDPRATGSGFLPDVDGDASGATTPLTADLDYRDQLDTDQDGVADFEDIDDDNDGILDTVEGRIDNRADFSGVNLTDASTTPQIVTAAASGGTLAAQVNVSPPVLTTDIGGTGDGGETAVVRASSGGNVLRYEVAPAQIGDVVENTLTFTDSSLDARPQIVQISTASGLASNISDSDAFTFTAINPPPGFAFIVDSSANAIITNDGASITILGSTPQAVAFAEFGIRTNMPIEGITVEYETFANVGLNSGQFIFDFLEERDTDSDGISDHLDIDSDNDGITDNIEAQSTNGYIAPSGTGNPDQGGSFVDDDRDGLDDNYDASQAANGVGSLGLDPVNSNETAPASLGVVTNTIPDYLDTDSDGDGISDTVEAGLTGVASGLSNASNDADGDGLFDVFDTQNSTANDDGFVVNEGIAAGAAALPDTDGDIGGAVLISDVDFRDADEPPVAQDDVSIIDENSVLSSDVLADNGNGIDVDPEGATLTVTQVNGDAANVGTQITLASGALLTVNPDGTYDYDPNGQFESLSVGETANDSFTYQISDGNGGFDTATVNITIGGVNDAPVAVDDPENATAINETVSGADLANAISAGETTVTGPDGTDVTITTISGTPITNDATAPLGGVGIGRDPAVDTSVYGIEFSNGVNSATIDLGYNNNNVDGDEEINVAIFDTNGVDITAMVAISLVDNSTVGGLSYDPVNNLIVAAPGSFGDGTNGQLVIDAGTLEIGEIQLTHNEIAGGAGNPFGVLISEIGYGINAQGVPYETDEDTAFNISAADGLLGNDTDPEGDALTVIELNGETADIGNQITLPSGALLTLNDDGSYSYDPNGQFESLAVGETTTDTFEYTISDGNGGTDTASVTITINGVNDAPIAQDDVEATDEDTVLSDNVLPDNGNGADSDADTNDMLMVSQVNGDAANVGTQITLASGAFLTVNPDGTYDYDPNGAFEGLTDGEMASDSFTYQISDGNGGFDTATVNITIDGVNDVPVAQDDLETIDEDTVLNDSILPDNGNGPDSDAEGQPLTVSEVNGDPANVGTPITLGSGALLTVNSDGTYSYDPNGQFESLGAGDTANDSFTYQISDGNGGFDTATVNITIDGVNDAPIAQDDIETTDEDTILSDSVLLDNGNGLDSDVEGDMLVVSEVNGDPAGVGMQITLASGALLTVNPDGTYDYDPNGAFEGLTDGEMASDSFTYQISDGNGGFDTATVNITVDGVNDAPVAQDDLETTDEDTVLNDSILPDNGNGPDSDAEGQPLTVSEVNGDPANVGTPITLGSGALLTVNSDGTYSYDPNGQFESLGAGDTANDSFTYQISDGNGGFDTATVNITIDGVNDAPVVVDPNNPGTPPADPNAIIPLQQGEDGSDITPLDVSEFFDDPDDTVLTFTLAPDAPSWLMIDEMTGEVTGTPPADASVNGPMMDGIYPVTIIASDPDGLMAMTVVTFDISNPAPVANDDMLATNENDAPLTGNVISDDNGMGEDVDGAQDNDPLIVSEVAGQPANVGQPTAATNGGQFTIEEDGSFSFDDNGDFEDLAIGETRDTTITYQISDGQGGFDDATITLTVTGTNDAPMVVDPTNPNVPPADTNMVIPEQMLDDSEVPAPFDVSIYFDDVDNDNSTDLTFNADNLPDGLMIDPDTGVITGAVDNSASQGGDDPLNNPGVYTVTITATDPEGAEVSTQVTYTVENPAPIAEDDLVTTDEDTNLTGNVLEDNGNGIDSDPDGDMLVVSQVGGSPDNLVQPTLGSNGGLFTENPDGSFEFVPGDDFNGLGVGETTTTEIEYEISDGEGGTDTATIVVIVTGTNDGPISVDPSQPMIVPDNPPQGVPFDPQTPFAPPLDPDNYIPEQVAQDSAPIASVDLTPFFGDPDTNDEVVISIDPADLPEGLGFDPVTNTITGTPASDASQGGDPANPGTYTIPVTATDESGETFTTNVTFVISNPAPTVVVAIEDFTETVGNDFETETADNFEDIDGDDLTFTAEGLPEGLTIDPATGVISGQLDPAAVVDAPNADGIYIVTVTVDDGQGGMVSASFTFTALDAFVPLSDEVDEGLVSNSSQPIEPESNEPFILGTLSEFEDERKKRAGLEQALFDVDENGFPLGEYRGGHESVETIAGNTVIRTHVSQDRVYLEVRSEEALTAWKVVNENGASDWEAYQDANLFVSMPSIAQTNINVTLQNEQLGIEVRIRIDLVSGKFDVLETLSLTQEEQASLNKFSKQIEALSDQHASEARNLLKALG